MNRTPTLARCAMALALLTIGLATSGTLAQTTAPAASPATADLPKASTLVDAALDAMGGESNWRKVKSMHVSATAETPMGAMEMKSYSGESDRFYVEQNMGGMQMRNGSDGRVAWMFNGMTRQYQLLPPEMSQAVQKQAAIHQQVLRFKDETQLKTVEKTSFDGTECYKVSVTDGEDVSFAYFSMADKYLIGLEAERPSPMGASKTITRFLDYKKFGDLTAFTKASVEQVAMNMTMVISFDTIEFNKVDNSVFELPKEVKDMAPKAVSPNPGG